MDTEKLTAKIRTAINKPRKQYVLLKNHQCWNQLCSSLDVIEDTQLAIDNYQNKPLEAKTETLYLFVYGLFQALYLQQDAVDYLSQALGYNKIDFKNDYPKLSDIREIRNDSVGHPTKRSNGSFHFISRTTLSYEGFGLLSYLKNETHVFREIDTLDCIQSQKVNICSILDSIILNLRNDEVSHKEKFKDEKLADIFPDIAHYYYEKIYESISHPDKYPASFGLKHIELIEGMLKQFEDALYKRESTLSTYGCIEDAYRRMTRRFENIKNYLTNTSTSATEDIIDFWQLSKIDFEQLVKCAKEIDNEYSTIIDD